MEVFGIFEGGGAKGLAHVGALKATENAGMAFIGVAGASAGSIVASLVAAGYSADEIFAPGVKGTIFRTQFLPLLGQGKWAKWKTLSKGGKRIFAEPSALLPVNPWARFALLFASTSIIAFTAILGRIYLTAFICFVALAAAARIAWQFCPALRIWVLATLFLLRRRKILRTLVADRGLLDPADFRRWLNAKLLAKLEQVQPGFVASRPDGDVAFKDLRIPLKVVASNVSERSVKVYGGVEGADFSVAEAVAISIRIPFVFKPHEEAGIRYVDGGIMSNFPAWLFDAEKLQVSPVTPILGFRLVHREEAGKETEKGAEKEDEFVSFCKDVLETAVFGDNSLEVRKVDSLYEIPVKVRIDTMNFDAEDEVKDDVYREALLDASNYFSEHKINVLARQKDVEEVLAVIASWVRSKVGERHLRINVMQPFVQNKLTVFHKYNMSSDEDTDDALQFARGDGCAGKCWADLNFVICDLTDSSTAWAINKYQRRLVRAGLTSILSVPLFHPERIRRKDEPGAAFLGVLNIDSDDHLIDKFGELVSLDGNRGEFRSLCTGLASTLVHKH